MRAAAFALALVVAIAAVASVSADVTVRAERRPETAWTWQHRCKNTDEVNLVFAVRQRNMGALTERLYEVSNPQHQDYTDYMTLEQIGELTRDEDALRTVEEWLAPYASVVDRTVNGDFVTARLVVQEAERMLSAEFHAYKHRDTGKVVFRASSYRLPEEVAAAIDYAARVVDFPRRRPPAMMAVPQTAGSGKAGDAYPAVIQKYYNIPTEAPTPAGSAPAISLFEALGQNYEPKDLATYQSSYGLKSNPISKVVGPNNPFTCLLQPGACEEASLDVQVASIAQGLPMWYWSIKSTDETPFVDWAVAVANSSVVPLVHSISYGGDEAEEPVALQKRFDAEVQKLGLRGVTVFVASGDDGVAGAGARSDPTKCGFNPSFPATIPHITAVGATMGPEANQAEIACTSDKGGLITTGGGFSGIFAQPSWQAAAVQAYGNSNVTLPPASMYNGTGRGYPDVAMMGHNYEIIINSQVGVGSGTSASTPLFAAVVALVNNERIAAGKKPLGFLNQALYQQAASNKAWIRDVTSGTNNCAAGPVGHADCCQYGFTAAAGWDPVTGFGSVDYTEFAKVFGSL